MVTLQQIYDRVGSGAAGVSKTGQTDCRDASGASVACGGTGQDGQYQSGVSASPRFTDNGNGTVKDNLTGLIWLKNANCFGTQVWAAALSNANSLASGSCGLSDGSVAGSWRLPNIRELQSLIDYSAANPVLPAGNPFANTNSSTYWSSTYVSTGPSSAWVVYFYNADVNIADKAATASLVWPVRNGQ
jgi:hypothetical protein